MKACQILAQMDLEVFEASWVFSTADAYVEFDLGQKPTHNREEDGILPQNLRRPSFRLNYPAAARAPLRLYKRPYFHLAED